MNSFASVVDTDSDDDFDSQPRSFPDGYSDSDLEDSEPQEIKETQDLQDGDDYKLIPESKSRKRRPVQAIGRSTSTSQPDKRLLRNVCVTWNNYPEQAFDEVLENPAFSYVIVGKEIGESKTPHLQIYAELKKRTRFNTVRKLFPGCHIESRKGTAQQASDYCKKDGSFKEAGVISHAGKRTDLAKMRQLVKEGKTMFEIMDECDSAIRYHSHVVTYMNLYRASTLQRMNFNPRPWQSQVLALLDGSPHPRSINWYYDAAGNTGKSTLCRYLLRNRSAFLVNGGKHANIAHAYNYESIVVFDLMRDQSDRVPYAVMESFKNGYIFSGKYNSTGKSFDTPHVFIFANFAPDRSKLSADRWIVTNLDPMNTNIVNDRSNPIVIWELKLVHFTTKNN